MSVIKRSVLALSFVVLAPLVVAQVQDTTENSQAAPAVPRIPLGIYAKDDISIDIANLKSMGQPTDPASLNGYFFNLYQLVLKEPAIYGLEIQIHWDTVNPNPPGTNGDYVWDYLDDAFDQVRLWNTAHPTSPPKTIMLIVTPGFQSPKWLLHELPSCDALFKTPPSLPKDDCGRVTFDGFIEEADSNQFPLPWDNLLRKRGLIRIPLAVPANADYVVTNVSNQYGCNETDTISEYRRPLPATTVRFLSAVMFDGRESSAATGTTKILYSNYPNSLISDLEHQSLDATIIHAQGDGTRPTPTEQQEIVNFEMGLNTAQVLGYGTGPLNAKGATGGPQALLEQPFFISINSSVNYLVPQLEQPGGLVAPGDGQFTPAIFNTFENWADLPTWDPRSAVARGEAIFNSIPINITGVAGINDDVAAGGLVAGGIPSLIGTCGTCHDTPNVGNHSFPTPLNIGTGDPNPSNASTNLGGLDISYLPTITVCKTDPGTGLPTSNCKTTTDLGQALIDGNFDHVGKIKGPILRGLSARAPYFHNGSARTLLDVVHFYETRFGLTLTSQQESDLVVFLGSL